MKTDQVRPERAFDYLTIEEVGKLFYERVNGLFSVHADILLKRLEKEGDKRMLFLLKEIIHFCLPAKGTFFSKANQLLFLPTSELLELQLETYFRLNLKCFLTAMQEKGQISSFRAILSSTAYYSVRLREASAGELLQFGALQQDVFTDYGGYAFKQAVSVNISTGKVEDSL